jgi:hypothetical protein
MTPDIRPASPDSLRHANRIQFTTGTEVLFEPTIKVLIAETQISTSTFRINGLIRQSTLLNDRAPSLGLRRSGSEAIQHQIAEYRIGEDQSANVPSDTSAGSQ